ncbi:hypothetical protein ACTWQN_23210 [Saccharopolyspora sp. 5N708]
MDLGDDHGSPSAPPLGTWGAIRTYGRVDGKWVQALIPAGAKIDGWRAMTNYRGHDGRKTFRANRVIGLPDYL